MTSTQHRFTGAFGNEWRPLKLSPSRPHDFVDNLLTDSDVGGPQRREIEQWRGLQQGAFGYNEGPTSSCHTFCWKARHFFDVPFFCLRHGPWAFTSLRDMSLQRDDSVVATFTRGSVF